MAPSTFCAEPQMIGTWDRDDWCWDSLYHIVYTCALQYIHLGILHRQMKLLGDSISRIARFTTEFGGWASVLGIRV